MGLVCTINGYARHSVSAFPSGLLVGRLHRDDAGRWVRKVLTLRHALDKRRTRPRPLSFVNTDWNLPCDAGYRESWYILGALRPVSEVK